MRLGRSSHPRRCRKLVRGITVKANDYVAEVMTICPKENQHVLRSPFTSKGKAKDVTVGAPINLVLRASREFTAMPLPEVERLLASPVEELRTGAVRILSDKIMARRVTDDERRAVYEMFMRHRDKVNTWSLVDIGSHHIVGGYLLDRPRDVLYEMAGAPQWWERRIALVSTLAFIRKDDVDDAFRLADLLCEDAHDRVQSAVGWILRDAGKRDRARLVEFLDTHAATLPRIALRAAIEHLDKDQRAAYLNKKKAAQKS